MKSEYALWKAELERGPRKPLLSLVWPKPVSVPPAEPDHFVWRDVGELFGGSAEGVAPPGVS
jgi:hypothetical protein